ncbi:potassium channel subfamily K member 18-like [Liolophura sinensis]|uniref:potassium channel subfamily K member 18-like n=1 Tax=Liolophura sinensis TaxID=3198878 RepID=UPI003158C86F
MVILYCVAGGFIFEHLEKNNELQICYESRNEYLPIENNTIESLIKVTQQYADLEDQRDNFEKILEKFRDNSIAIGYDGKNCSQYGMPDGPVYRWSWAGSLMFSVTVITTIGYDHITLTLLFLFTGYDHITLTPVFLFTGYGHIAPKTFWGRLVCIAYSVLGIPLMLLCLANIGDVLADIFRFIYAKVCCCGCCRKTNRTRVVQINSVTKEPEPGWDSLAKSDSSSVLKSVPPNSTHYNRLKETDSRPSSGRSNSRSPTPIGKPTVKIAPLDLRQYQGNSVVKTMGKEPEIIDDDSDDEDEFDESKITVPLTITMIVIAGYIFGGAVLFGLWEGWDWLQSAYFCFITLSTIGFGDVVPGTDFENQQAQAKLILGAVYLLFGMAILSMCFSLMQDEIVAKCRWVGRKLGILDTED